MPQPVHAPAREHPTDTPGANPVGLSLEDRLTLTNTAMTVALDRAAVAYEVNTAHIPTTPPDWDGIITAPTTPISPDHMPALNPYGSPVASLLQRAHQRLLTGGWCTGTLVDQAGARCLGGAIRAEAGGDRRLEAEAVAVLMDTIRRTYGTDVDSVPAFNDAWDNARAPLRMLDQAVGLADARGL